MANSITVNDVQNIVVVDELDKSVSVSKELKLVTLSSVGIQGLSAYDIAVKYGYIGTEQEWLNSTQVALDSKVDKTEVGATDTNYVNIFLYNMLN